MKALGQSRAFVAITGNRIGQIALRAFVEAVRLYRPMSLRMRAMTSSPGIA
jgi:hypothetical protein